MVSELCWTDKAYTTLFRLKSFVLSAPMPTPVTHLSYQIDPYTTYAQLRQATGFIWNDAAQAWLVSRAELVGAVLADLRCAVRPAHEAVPKTILGSAAGEIFSHLIRMNEAQAHRVGKASLLHSLGTLDSSQVQPIATPHKSPMPTTLIRIVMHYRNGVLAPVATLARDNN